MQTNTDLRRRSGASQAEESPGTLRNKTCVVTGSSRGIGRQIATEFARHGATVVVHFGTSAAEATAVVEEIHSAGGEAELVQANVADFDAVTEMAERVHAEYGPIDVLVNNAGVTADGRFDRLSPEDWKHVLDVNLGGAFNCTKAFYDDLREAEAGRIVNVSSVVGQQGNYGQVNYAASKSGLFGFTKSLALELAGTGTTVNCVAPGFTATSMLSAVPEGVQDRIRERIPMDRFASVEEIVPVVRFLASDDASYLTGEIVNVNGGMYA